MDASRPTGDGKVNVFASLSDTKCQMKGKQSPGKLIRIPNRRKAVFPYLSLV
jgi:hypothetical protein